MIKIYSDLLVELGIIFVIGLVFGSFYNVVGLRWLEGKSVLFPSSECSYCKKKLKPLDLIPVLSYLLLRGKCRYCGGKLSYIYPLGELATGFSFAIIYYKFGISIEALIYVIAASALIVTIVTDLKEMIVLDSVVAIFFVAVLCLRLYQAHLVGNYIDFSYYMLGAGAVFVFLLALFVFSGGKMGGGDVKIYAAIGMVLGAYEVFISIIISCLAALLVAAVLLICKKMHFKTHIPFVPFIWFGTLLTVVIMF